MPSNFSIPLEQGPTPDVTTGAKPPGGGVDSGQLATWGASATKDLAKNLGDYRDNKGLEKLSNELTNATAQSAQYYEQRNSLYRASLSADDNTKAELQAKLESLRAGQDQGVLTPNAAKLKIDSLVKDYSVRYPHLGATVRAMGSASQGNIHSIATEYGGVDPMDAAMNDIIKDSVKYGVDPLQIINANQSKFMTDQVTAGLDLKGKNGTLTKQLLKQGHTQMAANVVGTHLPELTGDLRTLWASGTRPTETMIDAKIASYKNRFVNQIVLDMYNQAGQLTSDSGVPLDITQADVADVTKVANDQLDLLGVQLKAADTQEDFTHRLDMLGKERDFLGIPPGLSPNSEEAGIFKKIQSMGGDISAYKAFLGTANAALARKQRISNAGGDVSSALTGMADSLAADPNSGFKQLAIEMVLSGQYDHMIGMGVVSSIAEGTDPAAHMPPEAAAMTKVRSYQDYTSMSPEDQTKYARSYANSMSAEEALVKPVLARNIANDPMALNDTLDKMAASMAPTINMGVTYTGDARNPFQWTDFAANTYNSDKLLKLNQQFKLVYDAFDPQTAHSFVTDYISKMNVPGIKPGDVPGVTNVSGKGKAKGAVDPWKEADSVDPKTGGQVSDKTSKVLLEHIGVEAKAQGVDPMLAKGLAFVESSNAKYLRNIPDPKTGKQSSSRGPLHITKGTFEQVNEASFGGKLNFDSTKDQIKASIALLKDLQDTYKDPAVTLAAYFLGATKVQRALEAGGRDAVLQLVPPGKNRPLKEYLLDAFKSAASK